MKEVKAITDFANKYEQFVFKQKHGCFSSFKTQGRDDKQQADPLEAEEPCFPECIIPDGNGQKYKEETQCQKLLIR